MTLNGVVAVRYTKPPTEGRQKVGEVMIVAAMRFVQWMNSRRTPATPNDVCTHFGVTRSTAYRWLRGYARAKGVPDLRGQLRLPDKPTGEHENETDPHH